jgi:hypothetical protein
MRSHRFSGFVILVACIAIMLRAAVPAGFMPDVGGKAFTMVICSLEGNKTLAVGDDLNPFAPKHKTAEKPCDFSIAKTFSADTGVTPFAAVLVLGFLFLLLPHERRTFIRARYLIPPAHAPPVSV